MSISMSWPCDRPRSGSLCGDDRLAVVLDAPATEEEPGALQEFKEECDINNIMAKFQRTGALEWAQKYDPAYLDVAGFSFQAAQDTILMAQTMFDDLPSTVRDRFGNDPAAFLDFMHDASNRDEMMRLGLLREAAPPPVVAAVAPTPSTP